MIAVLICGLILPGHAKAADGRSAAGLVTVSSGWLNVRSGPSTTSKTVSRLSQNSYVTLISRTGDWWKVEYAKGSFGYCHADYLREVAGSPVSVRVSSGALNVRSGPGTSHSKTGSLFKGETVIQLSTSNGWSRILYHGTKTGYVSAQYLSSSFRAVSLQVPSFKQTDSRWANLTIGNSGKTFAKIGCATTAVAMMESYRQGKTIYPNVMSRNLRYTSSGDLYWPADYTVITSTENYLRNIYDLLLQGKPVLFGARNTYGSQHWVVITGFTGGTSLSAGGFTIHDPGTYSRTTLAQFLNAYPTFYKYFYYN